MIQTTYMGDPLMSSVDENLYNEALRFINKRFPGEAWSGAAAMYTESGKILISTAPACVNSSVDLCHETGALCEAYKLDEKVTASICISRDDKGQVHILTPCGVCQERLYVYGGNVSVAVPMDQDSTKWEFKLLKEVQPYYWRNALNE